MVHHGHNGLSLRLHSRAASGARPKLRFMMISRRLLGKTRHPADSNTHPQTSRLPEPIETNTSGEVQSFPAFPAFWRTTREIVPVCCSDRARTPALDDSRRENVVACSSKYALSPYGNGARHWVGYLSPALQFGTCAVQ